MSMPDPIECLCTHSPSHSYAPDCNQTKCPKKKASIHKVLTRSICFSDEYDDDNDFTLMPYITMSTALLTQ